MLANGYRREKWDIRTQEDWGLNEWTRKFPSVLHRSTNYDLDHAHSITKRPSVSLNC